MSLGERSKTFRCCWPSRHEQDIIQPTFVEPHINDWSGLSLCATFILRQPAGAFVNAISIHNKRQLKNEDCLCGGRDRVVDALIQVGGNDNGQYGGLFISISAKGMGLFVFLNIFITTAVELSLIV